MGLKPIATPGVGVSFETEDCVMYAPSGGVTVGGVYSVDMSVVDSTTYEFTTLKAVATIDFAQVTDLCNSSIFVVALETNATSGAKVRVRLRGRVLARVDGTTDVTKHASGTTSFLIPVNAANNLAQSTALAGTTTLNKAVAISLETYTTNSVDLKWVLFNGVEGVGWGYSVA